MTPLQKFADRLCQKTGCTFFIKIIYNPGRHSRTVDFAEMFVAQPFLQRMRQNGSIEDIPFNFVHERDTLSENGEVFGRSYTDASEAFGALLVNIAGTELSVSLGRRTITVRVPKDIAKITD